MFTLPLDKVTEEGLEIEWEEGQPALASYVERFPHIDFVFEKPLTAKAKVSKVGQSVIVKAAFQTVLRFRCGRCLEEFPYPFSSSFESVLQPVKEASSEEEVELSEEDMETSFFEAGEIRLSELACEQIFLEIPYQPLCREECKGLCPTCGKDLNRTPCDCRMEEFETGFAVLRKLKVDHEEEKT